MNRRTTTVLAVIIVILIAVFAITRWQRAVATKKLLTDLPGNDYSKVMDAMTQLKERGRSITPALLEHLSSGNPAARWRAAILLGEVGSRAAWAPLEQALTDESPDVRSAAALALGKLGVKASASAIIARLQSADEDVIVRISAAQALGLLEDDGAVGTLGKIAVDTVEALEAKAWGAYSALKAAKEGLVKAQEAAAVPAEGADPVALAAAIVAAQKAIDDAGKPLDDAMVLLKAVNGRDPSIFDVVVEEGEKPSILPPADATWELRAACASALGAIGEEEGAAFLAKMLDVKAEPNAEVRTAAAYAMGDLARRTPNKVSEIFAALNSAQEDETGDVRAAALFSMGSLDAVGEDATRVERVLAEALEKDDFYWAREAARSSMERLGYVVPEG